MIEWPVRSVGNLATFHRGITWASSQESERPEPGCVPVLRIPNVQERLDTTSILFLRGISHEKRSRFAATRDWLLMVGSNGNPDRVGDCVRITQDTDFLFASFLVGVEPNEQAGVDPCFLHYLLRSDSVRKAVSDSIKGTTGLRNISLSHLAAHELRCPPPPQQRKIARILTTVDNLIEKTEALIAKYQAIKQGMMHNLFTRGVDEHGLLRPPYEEAPELYKQSELGWIPKDWEAKRLRDIAEVKGGKRLPAGQPFAAAPTPFPYVRVSDMHDWSVDDSAIEYVPEWIEPIIRSYKISCHDLYISIAGVYLGLVGMVPEKLDNAQLTENAAKIVFIDRDAQSKQFLTAFFNSPLFPQQLEEAKGIGAGVPKLALHRIEQFVLPVPGRTEQDKIADILMRCRSIISKEHSVLGKLQTVKTGLMQDLLTGKVRVKVDEAEEVARV